MMFLQAEIPNPIAETAVTRRPPLPLSAGTVLLLPNQSYITLVSLPA